MNTIDFQKNYVNHYLLLEKDFEETKQYVTIAQENFEAYSVAYLKLLLTIGSEIDVMLEVLAKEYDPSKKESGFGCTKVITKQEPDIKQLEIKLRDEGITILPWKCDTIPEWWTAYNEIKHNRYETAIKFDPSKKYYQYANQKNVLYSLAALFSLEMYAYRAIAIKNNDEIFVPVIKTMFSIINSHWKDVSIGNGAIVIGENMYMI